MMEKLELININDWWKLFETYSALSRPARILINIYIFFLNECKIIKFSLASNKLPSSLDIAVALKLVSLKREY